MLYKEHPTTNIRICQDDCLSEERCAKRQALIAKMILKKRLVASKSQSLFCPASMANPKNIPDAAVVKSSRGLCHAEWLRTFVSVTFSVVSKFID